MGKFGSRVLRLCFTTEKFRALYQKRTGAGRSIAHSAVIRSHNPRQLTNRRVAHMHDSGAAISPWRNSTLPLSLARAQTSRCSRDEEKYCDCDNVYMHSEHGIQVANNFLPILCDRAGDAQC